MTAASPDSLFELAFAHVAARALHVVADLGVADRIENEPRPAGAVAADVGVDADALSRLLRLLEAHGVFRCEHDGSWSHSPTSRLLRSDHPLSMRPFARMAGTSFGWASFTELEHSLRTGQPGICLLEPAGWVAYLESHSEQAEIFHASMTAKAHADVEGLLAAYDFSPHKRVVDVGGGLGHLAQAVVEACPGTSATVFERPDVAAHVGVRDRVDVVAGDFFHDPLPAGDAYVLMNILHDWDDPSACAILRAVAEAGRAENATILVLEILLPEGPAAHRAKTLDVMMLAMTGGRERTLSEYDALLGAAGMELVRVLPTVTAFSVIQARIAR